MNTLHYFFHLIAYYIAWAGCILLAAHGHGIMGTALVTTLLILQIYWQIAVRKQTHGLLRLIIILTFMGALFDSLMIYSGLILLASNPFAPWFTSPWMITIWISFAVVLYATMSRLFSHYLILALLAFIGFAIAYALGAKMGAAEFPHGYSTCVLIGTSWAFLLPLCIYVYQRTGSSHD